MEISAGCLGESQVGGDRAFRADNSRRRLEERHSVGPGGERREATTDLGCRQQFMVEVPRAGGGLRARQHRAAGGPEQQAARDQQQILSRGTFELAP